MLLFFEATLHTTLPWTNRRHARRSLLYRYSPPYLQYQVARGGTVVLARNDSSDTMTARLRCESLRNGSQWQCRI